MPDPQQIRKVNEKWHRAKSSESMAAYKPNFERAQKEGIETGGPSLLVIGRLDGRIPTSEIMVDDGCVGGRQLRRAREGMGDRVVNGRGGKGNRG